MLKIFFGVISIFFSFSAYSIKTEKIKAQIQPRGEIESVQQVQVSFSKPIIKLGTSPSENRPLDSNCFIKGSGYWIDDKNWVYQFEQPLEPKTKCKVSTTFGLKSYNGELVVQGSSEFLISQAQVLNIWPRNYQDVTSDQYFAVALNGLAEPEWIKKNVFFKYQSLGDQIGVDLVSNAEKEKVMEYIQRTNSYEFDSDSNYNINNIYVIKSARLFPRGQKIILKWGTEHEYNVQSDFSANLKCERESVNSGCNPLSNIDIHFSVSLKPGQLSQIYLIDQFGNKKFPTQFIEGKNSDELNLVSFEKPFYAGHKYKLILNQIKSLEDEVLVNEKAFPLQFETADYPSLLKISRDFSVIESNNPVLPITIRSIETPLLSKKLSSTLTGQLESVRKADIKRIIQLSNLIENKNQFKSVFNQMNITEMKPVNYSVLKKLPNAETEVVGIPLKENGLYFHEFKSRILGDLFINKDFIKETKYDGHYYLQSLSLVTDLNISVKYSPQDVLVWVNSLTQGQVLKNVKVTLYSQSGVKVDEQSTNESGLAYFVLNYSKNSLLTESKLATGEKPFYIVAETKSDFSYVLSSNNEGLESYRFNLDLPYKNRDLIFHTVIEKNLLRPKEVVKAKVIFRKITDKGLIIPLTKFSKKLQITFNDLQKKYLVDADWDYINGSASFDWTIPSEATLGQYFITFPTTSADNDQYISEENILGRFSIQEFKTASLISEFIAKDSPWINAKDPKIQFTARYLNGGFAVGMPFKVRYSLVNDFINIDSTINQEKLSEYNWQLGPVEEGIKKSTDNYSENVQPLVNQIDQKLSYNGYSDIDFKNIKSVKTPQKIVISAEYTDPNGDIQTLTRGYKYADYDHLIGVKTNYNYKPNEKIVVKSAVLDRNQKGVFGKKVTLHLLKTERFSNRKKILGGFYNYENFEEIKKIKTICNVTTDKYGLVSCQISHPNLAGSYVVLAEIDDQKGKLFSKSYFNVSSSDYWYGGSDSDRMDLIPNKKEFEIGEEAEFQIKGPINQGTLLITVERDRILHKEVKSYSIHTDLMASTFKLKVKPDWFPNAIISAVLVRGRIPAEVTSMLDLGKPSLKMGMTNVKVISASHKLNVKIDIEKNIYSPRENVIADIYVTDHKGRPINGEVTVAAIDEALLAIRDNSTFDLKDQFYPELKHDVSTAYLMSHVAGKRTLGSKAVPIGGDGSGSAARELFDTSLFWNPKVKIVNGIGKVQFKTNDSLTSFKVFAAAISGARQFGTGTSEFKIQNDVQVFSALPLASRQGDSFEARFNLRNSTKQALSVAIEFKMNKTKFENKNLMISSEETKEVSWPVVMDNNGIQQFEIKIVDVKNQKILDFLKVDHEVQKKWPIKAISGKLDQAKKLSIDLKKPQNSLENFVQLDIMPSLVSELPGLKKFWDDYPFDCFEQQFSKAITLKNNSLLEKLINKIDIYLDAQGLLKFYSDSKNGSVFLTNYFMQLVYLNKLQINDQSKKKMISALKLFFNGRIKNYENYNLKYNEYLRIETLDTLTMHSSIDENMFKSVDFNIEKLPLNYLLHLVSILKSSTVISNKSDLLNKSLQVLKSRSILSSSQIGFKDSFEADNWGMYTDEDMIYAKVLIALSNTSEFSQDKGKMMNSFIGRMKNGHWKSTMANAWAVTAIANFQKNTEKNPVEGKAYFQLGPSQKSMFVKSNPVQEKIILNKDQNLKLDFEGGGKPWWNILILSDASVLKDINQGISISKKWIPIKINSPGKKSVGDVWDIEIIVTTKIPFQWLVIRDPLPPGVTIVDESSFDKAEKRKLEFRIYQAWKSAGSGSYKYQVRLNQSGTFTLPTTTAEAMYNADLRGEILNNEIKIYP